MNNVYKVEVGVLLDKDNEDYDCYSNVYDKENAYYDENVIFELDYDKSLDYAKQYVENGVNGTYAIISKINCDNIDGSHIEEYIELFGGEELYNTKNVIYSLNKVRNEDYPYYLGKGNGKIIENFVKIS